MSSFLKNIVKFYANSIGWSTNRKIIVVESDDWGGIRMRSKQTIEVLSKKGITINDPYNLFDSLASEDDLELLFDLLTSYKDINNNHPIITANTIVANPNFNKIKESNFTEFYYEKFTDTLQRYPKHANSYKLWNQAIDSRVFIPQFHGRDHVNINLWLKRLKEKDKNTVIAFNNEIFGLRGNTDIGVRKSFMRALDFQNLNELNAIKDNLEDGIKIFHNIFGYYSKSYIAPSYVWSQEIEERLNENNIKYIQGIRYQYSPKIGRDKLKRKFHYIGQQNKFKQTYLVRNAFFEPSLNENSIIDETLNRIDMAFKFNKPAIIGSHRLNFIGFINEKNRDQNLKLFSDLLKRILKKWPDTEFMSSDQLGDLISKNNK